MIQYSDRGKVRIKDLIWYIIVAVCSRVRWTDPSDKKFSVVVFCNVYIPFDLFSKESTA